MNIRPYIILNGVNSQSIQGLLISELAPISKPKVRTQVETIDGRSGDIVTPLGYAAYDKEIKIGLTRNYNIDEIIAYFNSDGVVIFSNEPDKCYRYAVYEQIDFERLLRYRTAEITFHVQPFKFSTTEAAIIKNGSGAGISANVVNSGNIYSRPELLLTGSGNATVDLNSSEILSVDLDSANGAIFIDSENMNAYGAKSAVNNVIAYVNPYQDGEGDPSPDNERTIHGFTELNIIDTPDSNLTELKTIDNTFGGVVNFNQLVQNGNFSDNSRWVGKVGCTINSISDNIANVSFIGQNSQLICGVSLTNGHKFLSMCDIKLANANDDLSLWGGSNSAVNVKHTTATTNWQTVSLMFTSVYGYWMLRNATTNDINNTQIKNVRIFDLTQMFGSTIADYIYSLEQDHAGDGVAFFRNIYPNDYYDYNTGTRELMPLTEKTVYTVDISENPQDPDNPQIVYGGYYESTTGLLTVDKLYKTYNGSENWQTSGAQSGKYRAALNEVLDNVLYPTSTSEELDCICNMFVKSTAEATYKRINGISYQPNYGLRIYSSSYDTSDITPWKTLLAGTPLQVVYKLATPIEIQLAPTQINNLIGLNQVFTDTNGDVAVDYRASGEAHFEQAPIVSYTCTFEDIIKGTLLNRAVTGNYDNIKLNIGLNNIVVNGSGVKQLAIDKYSRWL